MIMNILISTLFMSLLEGYTVQDDNFPVTSLYLGSHISLELMLTKI